MTCLSTSSLSASVNMHLYQTQVCQKNIHSFNIYFTVDQPFTFTASGLHAHPQGGSTRSRSSVRSGLGGNTKSNVDFSMPE